MAVYKVNSEGQKLPIDTVAAQAEQRKRDRLTIVGVLRRKRELDRETEKRKRGLKTTLITGAVVMVLYILFAVFVVMSDFNSELLVFVAILLATTFLIFVIPALLFGHYINVVKPRKEFEKEVAADFPGMDLSSEAAIKSHVWALADEPKRLIDNLRELVIWQANYERDMKAAPYYEKYTPLERVVIEVSQTNSIADELRDLEEEDPDYFDEVRYLEGAVESFRAIGADEEAQIWDQVCLLFDELQKTYEYAYEGYSENAYAERVLKYSSEVKERLVELEYQLEQCRPNTERRLYDYVMQHKPEFGF